MKYLMYCFMTIASACLVILMSLSSCSPTPQTTNQPMVMEHPATTQTQANPQKISPVATATVKIHNFKFDPATVAIVVGETIQFINVDEEPHTTTSTDGAFDSKALDTNESWSYTATKPGTFPYICSIHPFMKGTLTVTPRKS